MSGKSVGVTVTHEGHDWFVEGTYWPAYRAARENGLPVEPDEPETFEPDNVFLVIDGGKRKILIPFEALDGLFVDDLVEKATELYKSRLEAAEEDYWDMVREEMRLNK